MTEKTVSQNDKPHGQEEWGGAFAAYGKIFEGIKKNPAPVLLVTVVYALASTISTIFQDGKLYMDPKHAPVEDITYLVFLLAMMVYALALADGKRISISQFMRFDLKKYVFVAAAGLLYILIVGVSLLLLIIPAIWTIAWLFAAPYIVVDKNMGPIKALKESKRLAQNHKGKVWGLIGVTTLLGIFVGLMAYIPYVGGAISAAFTMISAGTSALLYRWLQKA